MIVYLQIMGAHGFPSEKFLLSIVIETNIWKLLVWVPRTALGSYKCSFTCCSETLGALTTPSPPVHP